MSILFLFPLALLLASDEKAVADAAKKEWAALNGVWRVQKLESGGKSMLEEAVGVTDIVLKDGAITGRKDGKDMPSDYSSFKLDPSRKPKSFTSKFNHDTLIVLGIYALEKDELKICATVVETKRLKERAKEWPTEFDSNKGVLIVLKRVGND